MAIDLAATLGRHNLDAFMYELVRGRYHLLLGAGASNGGKSSDDRPLPGADDLATELEDTFGIPHGGAKALRRIYAAARARTAVNGQTLPDYLKARFTETVPPEWMRQLTVVPWAHIWTLNIDDCLERAYGQADRSARQTLQSVSWTERHRTPSTALHEVLAVHLHGKAGKAQREDEIVFDISGYVHATVAQHRWHRIFGDAYPANPFLIVGASLDSEIDLQIVLEQGRVRGPLDAPSILVTLNITAFQQDEYRRYGLLVVDAKASDFFEAVTELLPQYLRKLTHEESLLAAETPPETFTFLSQWQHLAISPPTTARADARHDYYSGHEPEWRDIMDGLPSERDVEHRIVSAMTDEQTADVSAGLNGAILVLSGESFTGKSSVLLDVARRLGELGYMPYLYVGETAPDVGAVASWLQRHPRTVLLIDDASDFSLQIERLVRRTEGTPTRVALLATDRVNRLRHIESVLATVPFSKLQLHAKLSRVEVGQLVSKLSTKRRLGSIRDKTYRDQLSYFERHGRELFSAMAELEHGRGFVARIKDEYAAVQGLESRELLGSAAIVSDLGYGLPLILVTSVSGLLPRQVGELVGDGDLADLFTIQNRTLRLRHRILGSLIVQYCLDNEARFSLAKKLALALAPHVSPAAMGAQTINARIARTLMTAQSLRRLLGSNSATLDWYAGVETEYDWNARYWEQRALAAAEAEQYERAYSWAREAVARRKDSYTLNTVGTVLMQRAMNEASTSVWPTESFESAAEALAEARDLEREVSEYPYETFFHYLGRLVSTVRNPDAALVEQLRSLWINWHTRALTLDAAYKARIQPTISSAQQAWRAAGLPE